jgi:hypothetical protein
MKNNEERGVLMKIIMGFMMVVTMMYTNSVAAIAGAKVVCVKPRFSKMLPADKSEIEAGAEFSFVASRMLNPYTLTIKLKDTEVNDFQVRNKNTFYQVSGTFPESVKGRWARVHVHGESKQGGRNCFKRDGWLLKIKGDEAPTVSEALDASVVTP